MKDAELLQTFDLDEIWCCDAETYWASDYSLRSMATTEYITDPRFELQLWSVMRHTDKKPTVLVGLDAAKQWAKTVNWKRAGLLGHHTQFDGFIASRHIGFKPKMNFCTMSMARPIMPITVSKSLQGLSVALGLTGKKFKQALEDVKGKRLADFTSAMLRNLTTYGGHDVVLTWGSFRKMLPFVNLAELRLIDITIKMYTDPHVLIDQTVVDELHNITVSAKEDLLANLRVTRAQIRNDEQFVELLRKAGVEPARKLRPKVAKLIKQGLPVPQDEELYTWALSKQDLEFKQLLQHGRKRVRELAKARFDAKSSITETRSKRMSNRSTIGAQPIYLNYCGARTLRWSGGDKSNWQNLSRGSDLRTSIHAAPGRKLIIADLAQIEARLNAWHAGQEDILEAFANREDVYKLAASRIYNKPIDKITKDERFVGKVAVLALGYQAGWQRFAEMLRIGAFGPPVQISDDDAQRVVKAWREANHMIVKSWKRAQNRLRDAFIQQTSIEDGVLTYVGQQDRILTLLPGGTYMRYDGVELGEDGLSYISEYRTRQRDEPYIGRTKLYGGIIIENDIQALARRVIADQMIEVADIDRRVHIAMSTHDEIVCDVPDSIATKVHKAMERIMATPPEWAPDLPLAVEAHISQRYDK